MHRNTLILVALIAIPFYSICQCTSTGLKNATTFGNDASTGSLAFSSPSNAQFNDANYASAQSVAVVLGTATSQYLKANNFHFNLPASAVVCGVQVSVAKQATGLNILATVTDSKVNLLVNGVISVNNYATSTAWDGSPNTTSTYGGSSDRWGFSTTNLNYLNINSSNFAVLFSAKVVGLAALGTAANIDQIQASVYYDVALLALELESFTAINNNGTCFLSWAVNADNSMQHFILQRSSDLNNWQNISNIVSEKNQQQYLFEDENLPTGNSYYRLQLISGTGSTSYSNISMVTQKSDASLKIYPNPASDNFTIVAKKNVRNILVRDEYGRTVKSLNLSTATNHVKIPVTDLKTGAYFVQIDDAVLKLWKK